MAPTLRTPVLRSILLCSLIAAMTLLPPAARAGDPLKPEPKIRLCVVVSSSPDYVILQWYPMLTYLTGAIGRPFEILIRDSYEDMLDDYRRGEIDLLMSGPFNYVKTKQAAGATLVAAAERLDPNRFHGVIAVRGASSVDSLEELRGKIFAFTEPYSTTGYLLPRLLMADAGIVQPADFFREVVFSGHHAEALEAVISGHVDAAAFVSYLVEEAKRDRGIDLKVIATTPTLPPEPVYAHPSLDPALVARIRDALLVMHERVPPDVMERLGLSRFSAVADSDYDSTREAEKRLAELPPLPYTIDYGLMPSAISDAEEGAWSSGLRRIMAVPAAAALLLAAALLAFRRRLSRELRLKFAASLFAAMVLVSIAVSGLSAANLRWRLGNITLAWQRSINIFTALASNAAAKEGEAPMSSLVESLAAQEGIRYVKVFRNGVFVADSEHKDVGLSIVPKVLSGTFRPSASEKRDAIDAMTFIMGGQHRYGAAQIGIDTSALRRAVSGAFVGNLAAVAVLLALGLAIALIWSRQVARPIEKLGLAVADMRAGRRPRFDVGSGEDEIGELARNFAAMGAELGQAGELLKLKEQELDAANRKLEEVAGVEERIEDALDEIGDEEEPPERAIDAIRGELGSMAQVAAQPEADVEALRSKIAEIEAELPALARLRATEIIGTSPAFLRVIRDIVIRARDGDPVLLHGESGSGKTGVARAIHELSSRCNRPMVEYNCAEFAAADPAIVLGKLFGYGRDCGIPGVPREGQRGLLEECDGTTLFLDEIALLPPQAQGALLLPIEGRPFNPAAGKGQPRSADVRFIFASNARLEDEVEAGRFRNDLLRRIRSRGCIDIPPLRERMEDVPTLAPHFLGLWAKDKGSPMELGAEAAAVLEAYDWRHFNVAELATAVKVAADNALFRGEKEILPAHLPAEVASAGQAPARGDAPGLFDAEELRELTELRRNSFRMAASEAALGYARDAKTLSNHLRGMAYKVLPVANWSAEGGAVILAGGCVAARERIRRKIEFYLKNAGDLVCSGGERRIFNNLPQKYHRPAEELIGKLKGSST